jgi:hypothetical protein
MGSDGRDMFAAPEEEQAALAKLVEALSAAGGDYAELRLTPARPGVTVPRSLLALIRRAVSEMRHGAAVTVLPVDAELSVDEAAEILGEEPSRVRTNLASGAIPHRMVEEPLIRLADLLQYRERRNSSRREALREITALGEDADLNRGE